MTFTCRKGHSVLIVRTAGRLLFSHKSTLSSAKKRMMPSKQVKILLTSFLIVSLQVKCFNSTIHESSSSDPLSDQIGHVIYKAAYDVLASRQKEVSKDRIDAREVSPSQELLDSTIDFLSDVVSTAEESWTQVGKKSSGAKEHHRSPRSVSPPTQYRLPSVPELGVDERSFAHEYVPRTGIANREVIKITGIREEAINLVIPTPTSEAFRFIRFNSSNHLLSLQRYFVNVWRFNPALGLNFDSRHSLCQIDSRHEGKILRAEFFSRIVHHEEILQLALVIDTPSNGFQLRSYTVDYTGCHAMNIVELKGRPVKVTFVSSHYESATVVLSEGYSIEPRIDFSQSARDVHSRVIEVSVKNAIDLESFVIDGHSFLAIAYSQGVDVLRLNEFLHHSMLFDVIKVAQITDIVAFQMGFDYFIGISTSAYSQYLYEFRDGSFRIKQTFPVMKVERWQLIEVPSCREDYIVAFVRMDNVYPILLYLWDGQMKQFVLAVDNLKKYIPSFNYNLNPRSMVSVPFNHTGHLLLLDSAGRPHALSFFTTLYPVSDPLYTWTQGTTNTMKNLLNRIHSQEQFLKKLQLSLNYAVRKTGPVALTLATSFRDLTAQKKSAMRHISGLSYFALQGSPITLGDLGFRPNEIRDTLSRLKNSVSSVQSQLKMIAYKNEHTVMSGKNLIQSAVGYVLNSSSLTVDAINGELVTPLLKSTYRSGHSTIVRGKKFFENIKVERNINSRINGIDLGRAVLLDVPQTITSPVTFGRFSVRNNLKVARVNNLDLNKNLIRIDSGNYAINTPITITNQGVTVNELASNTISGIDVVSMSRSVLRKSIDQTITSPLVFNQPLTVSNIVNNKLTNGISLKQLESDLVRIDRPALITGRKLFLSDLVVKSDLNISDKLNGLRIPNDLFLASVPQIITGNKRLAGQQRFEGPVTVASTVSGLRLPGDVVTLTGTEPIPHLQFKRGIDVFDNVSVAGKVDGVDISQLSSTVIKGNDGKLHNPRFHGPVFIRGNIECPNCLINGIKIASLASDAIMKGSRDPVVITGSKEMKSVLFAPNIEAVKVNNIDLKSIATTNGHESISRLIINEVGFNNLTIQSAMIGNVNVMTLHLSYISLSNPGFIESGKNFLDTVIINGDLIVDGSIAGIFPNRDLVLKTGNQVIPGAKTFLGPLSISASLTVHGQLTSGGLIDGVNVTKLNLIRVSLNTQQITRMAVQLNNCKTISVFSTSINNLDLRSFVPDILLKTTGRQIITGNKRFVQPTHVFNDISSAHGIDGIKLDQVKATAIHLRPNNPGKVTVITAPMAFGNHLRVGDVTLYGLINKIDLQRMVADSLTTAGNCVLVGANTLLNGVDIVGDLNVGKINGHYLPTSVFLKTGNQVVTGAIKFTKPITINKNIDITGLVTSPSLVKGVNIQTLDRGVMKINRPNVVTSILSFSEDLTVIGDIRVKGTVDGVKLSNLVRRTLFKMFDQTITGRKTFLAPTTSAGSDLGLRYLNDIDFHKFISDMVFINKRNPIAVNGFKNFTNHIFIKRNLAHGVKGTTFYGPINRVFVTSLANSAIPLNQPGLITGTKTFDSPLIVSRGKISIKGKLNRVNIVNDVLFTSVHPFKGRNQVIRGKKVFYDVKSMKSIDVKGLINGVSLANLARDTLYTKGNQFIQSKKFLSGRFMVLNNLIAKRLNSMSDVRSELVTLHGHQHFSGDITFARTLVVAGNVLVRGAIAGQNMTELVLYSMYKDVDQVITGTVVFDSIFFGSDVATAGPVNGVHLNYLNKEVDSFKTNLKMADEMIRSLMTNQLKRTTRSYEQLLTNPFKIDALVLVQELPNVYGQSYETGSVLNGPSFGEQDYATSNSTVHKLIYNSKAKKWITLTPLKNMAPNKVYSFNFGKLNLKINQYPVTSEGKTQLVIGNKIIASFEPFLDDVYVMVKDDKTVYISTLLGIDGKVKVYSLKVVAGVLKLTNIAIINVGPSATKITSFMIDGELYLVVARNFRSECSIKDFGTLVFQFMNGKTFQLVQRLPVNDANHLIHYESNNQHYLLIDDHNNMNPSIRIFRRKSGVDCAFESFQSIPTGALNDISLIDFGTSEVMSKLLVTVNHTHLVVRQQRGHSGFHDSWSVTVDGGSSIQSWITEDDHRLFLIIGQTRKCTGSLVFEIITKGSTLLPVTFKHHSNQCNSVVT